MSPNLNGDLTGDWRHKINQLLCLRRCISDGGGGGSSSSSSAAKGTGRGTRKAEKNDSHDARVNQTAKLSFCCKESHSRRPAVSLLPTQANAWRDNDRWVSNQGVKLPATSLPESRLTMARIASQNLSEPTVDRRPPGSLLSLTQTTGPLFSYSTAFLSLALLCHVPLDASQASLLTPCYVRSPHRVFRNVCAR